MRSGRHVARHRRAASWVGSDGLRRPALLVLSVLAAGATLVAAVAGVRQLSTVDGVAPVREADPQAADAAPDPSLAPSPSSAPPAASGLSSASAPASGPVSKLLFGIGTEANDAAQTRLVREAPARMLTSWYNKPADLAWMSAWRGDLVPESYAGGFALHLVVFTDKPEGSVDTKYGAACGRPYPLSDGFLGDMSTLAKTFAGARTGPPLYVTLFTEFQTYACVDNAYRPDAATTAYYRALKDRYLAARKIFKETAPNAKVSLGWGGWQARFDDPGNGGGRSMIGHFADVLRESDFQSFQAMQSDTNVADIRRMVAHLAPYGPVMLAHYKPDNGSQATFDRDMRAVLNEAFLREMTIAGLFALSFMDDLNLRASQGTYQFVLSAVHRFARAPT